MGSLPVRCCSVAGCTSVNYEARGLCKKHYDNAKNSGQLSNLPQKTLEQRFWEKVDKTGPIHPDLKTPCWIWTAATNPGGYGQIRRGGRGSDLVLAHRLSWELARGFIPEALHALHKCDNPPCVNPAHLFLGTNQDNIDDRVSKGRPSVRSEQLPYGEAHRNAKLTAEVVREARVLFANGIFVRVLATKYGVSSSTMYNALIGKTWQHVV